MTGRKFTSYESDKDNLLLRVRRMEGQIRGIGQMIENDRYCLDILQQVNALTSAAREVSLRVLEAHLRACVQDAVKENDGDAAIQEMVTVLRKTLRP